MEVKLYNKERDCNIMSVGKIRFRKLINPTRRKKNSIGTSIIVTVPRFEH